MFLIFSILLLLQTNVSMAQSSLLDYTRNTKEAESKILKGLKKERFQLWKRNHYFNSKNLVRLANETFAAALAVESDLQTYCDLGFVTRFRELSVQNKLLDKDEKIANLAYLLRDENLIDDVLLRIIIQSDERLPRIEKALTASTKNPRTSKFSPPRDEKDLEKMFKNFQDGPTDDINKCSIINFVKLFPYSSQKDIKDKYSDIQYAAYKAYKKEIIDRTTYKLIYQLTLENIHKQPVLLDAYFDIALNAKNKMLIGKDTPPVHEHTSEYANRRMRLTNRMSLYAKYSPTQVIMLAQIIERTAKRLESPKSYLTFEITGEDPEIYVFSPMEQYRASLKILRKDIGNLNISPQFANLNPTFDDLISAAYEAGYIKSDELEMIVKFEDFWNPQVPKWKTYAGFVTSIGATASWFLPPPWNIIGAIGLTVLQSTVINKDPTPNEDDNWNVII